jgi:DNA gyrase subunit A
VKRTSLKEYANIRRSGIQAINLREDDELIEVKSTNNKKEIIIITKFGQCTRFDEKEVRSMGRNSMGVKGITLKEGDEVVAMQLDTQGDSILIVTEKGMGKRTDISEFPTYHRGGKGIICHKITDKTGYIVSAKSVNDDNEVMIITTEGIIIQVKMDEVRSMGRNTSGVKLIDIDKESEKRDSVASMAKVRDKIEPSES